jgi:hypothetical protein
MDRLILLLMLSGLPLTAHAQPERGFAWYDSATYQLWAGERWGELIALGREGLELGHDSFYLRMRLGIALYEKEKYAQAIPQFRRALEFDSGSADARQMLHYCLLYLGRDMEAGAFYKSADQKARLFQSIYLEPGVKLSDDRAYTRDVRYIYAGLRHEFGYRLALSHGYQRLSAGFAQPANGGAGPGPGGGGEILYTVHQDEYYASPTLLVSKGFYLSPSLHFQRVGGDFGTGSNRFFGLQAAVMTGRFRLYAGGSRSEINGLNQTQLEGGVVYYPLGSLNLYFQPQITRHEEEGVVHWVYFQKAGFRAARSTWLEVFGSLGNMRNFGEQNGWLLFNQPDTITGRFGLGLIQMLGAQQLYAVYTAENKEEYITGTPFRHHLISVGIRINL